ncbi:MAG: electron transport complex subunit RsxC [Candidatus Omnitrophota bacterium]
MLKTFRGGVHPPQSKDFTVDRHIRTAPVPRKVAIPLLQHTGAPCEPLVAVGDEVKTGQLIADSEKFISSAIHASISGKVTKIEKSPHPLLGSYIAIMIEGDGLDRYDHYIKKRRDIASFSDELIRDTIKQAGIVGLGGAAFPAHVKLTPPENKPIDSIILNGVECEPYLTCDHRLMLEKTMGIVEGLKVIKKLTRASNVYVGIESNKIGAAFALEKVLKDQRGDIKDAKIVLLKTKYPQGAEKQLIKSILNREVPPGKLPFDVGCIVTNVGTAFAIHEAVFEGKPLYERAITMTGSPLREPANLIVRIGTSVRELVDTCGGFSRDPAKVISGGPMMGVTQFTLDAPIIKGTSGILFLSKEEAKEYQEKSCIRCAKCVDVCPMRLVPTDITRLAKQARYQEAVKDNIDDCIECGACVYECPSRIPLLQWIRIAKAELLKIRRGA